MDDRLKLLFDFYRHLSTLCVACILLMAGLCERVISIFDAPYSMLFMFTAFTLSLLSALVTMLLIVNVPEQKKQLSWWDNTMSVVTSFTVIGFLIGLALAVYALLLCPIMK